MRSIRDIKYYEGVRILIRADFNVPVRNEVVVDDFRIRMALETIDFLREKKAKIILVSHMEAVDGTNPSLKPVANKLTELGCPVTFMTNVREVNEYVENRLGNGECILLENIRNFEGEKKNDPQFAAELASLADIYVNEAFPVCHREHASVVGVPKIIEGYAGLQLEREVSNLSKAFNPEHPFVFILGGAKFETKLPLLDKFLHIADKVFVGGALSNDFFRTKGYEIGKSTVSKGGFDFAKYMNNAKILIPSDIVNENNQTKAADGVGSEDKIMDAGVRTIEELGNVISSAQFILWNGPLGLYEDGYRGATLELAKIIAERTRGGATSVVGGGDTVAAIETLGITKHFTFVSTGGGAMLDFLAKGSLPGIAVLG